MRRVILEVYRGSLCRNVQYNPFTEFVTDMVGERDLYRKQGKELLQTLSKKMNNWVYPSNNRRDVYDKIIRVAENWFKKSKTIWMKNGGLSRMVF